MKTTTPRLLLLLPWLSLPLVAAVYLLLWDRIPERLVVHFDPAGRPNGSMTRVQSLVFDLALLLVVLVAANLKLRTQEPRERNTNLVILFIAVTFATLVFLGILKYNITGSLF
jgi:uncharacterized membrane protein